MGQQYAKKRAERHPEGATNSMCYTLPDRESTDPMRANRRVKMGHQKVQIMILDDEEIVGKRLKTALEKSGYEVEIFQDSREAVARIADKDFDIVVTDIRMDEIDGMQVLELVLEKSDRTKVIIITGYATVEVAREALTRGAFDFIAKPFKPNDLREIITRAVRALGL
jgi:DNA-binding NtrC family response regulator